jgi:hypothetical protein
MRLDVDGSNNNKSSHRCMNNSLQSDCNILQMRPEVEGSNNNNNNNNNNKIQMRLDVDGSNNN